jgi:hypothetical protein
VPGTAEPFKRARFTLRRLHMVKGAFACDVSLFSEPALPATNNHLRPSLDHSIPEVALPQQSQEGLPRGLD